MNFGATLREQRKMARYTLEDVHQRTQLSISFLSEMERDLVQPSLATLDTLRQCYGLSPRLFWLILAFSQPENNNDN